MRIVSFNRDWETMDWESFIRITSRAVENCVTRTWKNICQNIYYSSRKKIRLTSCNRWMSKIMINDLTHLHKHVREFGMKYWNFLMNGIWNCSSWRKFTTSMAKCTRCIKTYNLLTGMIRCFGIILIQRINFWIMKIK